MFCCEFSIDFRGNNWKKNVGRKCVDIGNDLYCDIGALENTIYTLRLLNDVGIPKTM